MKHLFLSLIILFSLKVFSQNNVGIGTVPHASARLHVDMGASIEKGLLVTGTNTGFVAMPNLGAGSRLMFYPVRSAFRAGLVNGTQWDNINVGFSSTAFGTDAIARGNSTLATGTSTIAIGNNSFVMGFNTIAKGYSSIVAGIYNDTTLAADSQAISSTSPLFIIGNGANNSRSNAVLVRKDGNVAIGNFNPEFRLDVGNRMRLRSGGDEFSSPGIWLNKVDNTSISAFIGMLNDNHFGIWGNLGGGWQFGFNTANGNVGIGNPYPGVANKLDVAGNINLTGTLRINDHPGFTGQVLTSNGSNSPTWQNMPVSNPQVGFYGKKNGTQSLPHNTTTAIDNYTEAFDDGIGFNPTTGVFTAPSDGMYHFDAQFSFNVNPTFDMTVNCGYYVNGIISQSHIVSINSHYSTNFSYNLKLLTGNTVTLRVYQNNGTAINVTAANTFFSGYKIY